ncbi:MAG TPA: type VI immunity family protein [Archangium sp.]|uniref:type VI immunity family protein n=1 Tax=Archangium sp. TaxID=1872627 RepID=UPI002E31BAAC|nr:type VI immunity family protein [Archangium sp.]HEX5745799.1 type VI immunity family protein [Archangium sp.]
MTRRELSFLAKTRAYDGDEVVVVRPGMALLLYTAAPLPAANAATADVLESYLRFIPEGAIATTYVTSEDEYVQGGWEPFDLGRRTHLLNDLRTMPVTEDIEGYGFVLSSSSDGQAGQFGARYRGSTLAEPIFPNETSLLRLEFPWDFLNTVEDSVFLAFIREAAELFPFSTGHAGMSFIYTISYEVEAREEIQKLVPRFLGFDPAYDWVKNWMRGRVLTAHWLNLLDNETAEALGGEEKLRSALEGCEVQRLRNGLLIRGARHPPVGDVNRGAGDLGLLPLVAKVLRPRRFEHSAPLHLGLPDEAAGQAWLERFDLRPALAWDNR